MIRSEQDGELIDLYRPFSEEEISIEQYARGEARAGITPQFTAIVYDEPGGDILTLEADYSGSISLPEFQSIRMGDVEDDYQIRGILKSRLAKRHGIQATGAKIDPHFIPPSRIAGKYTETSRYILLGKQAFGRIERTKLGLSVVYMSLEDAATRADEQSLKTKAHSGCTFN